MADSAVDLPASFGPNTMWIMVNFSRTYIDKKRQGRRSLYVDTKTESFELEAISRPGFFLIVDAQGFLTLKDKRGHTIKFTKETVWDDINDGK